MIKKFKNVISQFGTGNIAILKSKHVTVNNIQAMDKLNELIQKGNWIGAAKLMFQMKKYVDSQHPAAPHYKYEFSEDESGGIWKTIVPAYPEAPVLHPLKGNFRFILPEKYRRFKNMAELLHNSYCNQENIELDAIAFKTWVDETIIDDLHKKDFASFKLTLIPEKFPPPTPMRLYLKGHAWSIDYLEIGVTKIDGSTIFIDNHKQKNVPFYVQFIIDITGSRAEMKIEIKEDYLRSVRDVLIFKEFAHLSNKRTRHKLALKLLKEDSDIFIAEEWNFNEDKSDETMEFLKLLKKLKYLEEELQGNFTLPIHGFITENEAYLIDIIYSSLINHTFKEKLTETISVKIKEEKEIASLLSLQSKKKNGFSISLNNYIDEPVSIFGFVFPFNIHQILLEKVSLKDAELLERKLAIKDEDEELIVKFKPVGKSSYVIQKFSNEIE